MIEIKNITKRFDTVTAVSNLSCTLKEGIYGLVGQNGAGKSTLLRIISNVILPNEGEVLVDSIPCQKKEAKESVFFLPDNPYNPKHGYIKDVLAFYQTFYDIDTEKFHGLRDTFHLPLDVRVSTFSKGMKRQLFLAIALSVNCKYLLLDEAFDGIDPIVLETIRDELLKKKEEGTLIIVSSHNITSLEKIADHFLIISKGRLAKEGDSESLGNELIKYQAYFKTEVTKEDIQKLNIHVVYFRKTGSITNFVIQGKAEVIDTLKSNFDAYLLENIPLTSEEIVTLEMMVAKEDESHD